MFTVKLDMARFVKALSKISTDMDNLYYIKFGPFCLNRSCSPLTVSGKWKVEGEQL